MIHFYHCTLSAQIEVHKLKRVPTEEQTEQMFYNSDVDHQLTDIERTKKWASSANFAGYSPKPNTDQLFLAEDTMEFVGWLPSQATQDMYFKEKQNLKLQGAMQRAEKYKPNLINSLAVSSFFILLQV